MNEAMRQEGTILHQAEMLKDMLLSEHNGSGSNITTYDTLVDTRIAAKIPMITPDALDTVLPLSDASRQTTSEARLNIAEILSAADNRLIVIVGPCSIHDPEATMEYVSWLAEQREIYGDTLEIIMRAYMEKPRTELGWKGLIYDPLLNESNDINLGVTTVKLLAGKITGQGVPIAMERLNASTPQYVNGLVAYDAIGARNTTDQKAREYASGSSAPVGFKNTPEGSIQAAVEAVKTANAPHTFLGMATNGMPMQVETTGNPLAHIILRGDKGGPNYSVEHVTTTKEMLIGKGLLEAIIVDASHGNSEKDYHKQFEVVQEVGRQIAVGETALKGVMIESNLVADNQPIGNGRELVYGQSITDACVDLTETSEMLALLSTSVKERRNHL